MCSPLQLNYRTSVSVLLAHHCSHSAIINYYFIPTQSSSISTECKYVVSTVSLWAQKLATCITNYSLLWPHFLQCIPSTTQRLILTLAILLGLDSLFLCSSHHISHSSPWFCCLAFLSCSVTPSPDHYFLFLQVKRTLSSDELLWELLASC